MDLSRLAQSLGSDWEVVATELGLSKVEIDHCRMENHTVTMMAYAALNKWRNKVSGEATLTSFISALELCGTTTIDWDTVKKAAQKMS